MFNCFLSPQLFNMIQNQDIPGLKQGEFVRCVYGDSEKLKFKLMGFDRIRPKTK